MKMKNFLLRKKGVSLILGLILNTAFCLVFCNAIEATVPEVTQGSLQIVSEKGEIINEFPLKHTDVQAEVSGMVARVTVKQLFHNPYNEKIEAVYVFPLPNDSAVDDMLIKVGDRTIKGLIKKREEAKKIYEEAKKTGHIAGLLEQERPNIFTQSVANIVPGDQIEVTIKYVQPLKYEDGNYEFVFPMVVGPRYIPGTPIDTPSSGGWAPNTNQVPDASRITPPVLKPEERLGHDISLIVNIDAGVHTTNTTSPSHKIEVTRIDESKVTVKLHPQDTIPNKDFILRYHVAGEKPQMGLLTHRSELGGFFTLLIQPKANYQVNEIAPREMVFVIDCSGSMSGAPIEKAKEAVRRCISKMNPQDTFQVINFSMSASGLSNSPLPNTPENIQKALSYINSLSGEGGTEMLTGIKAALDYPEDPNRLRIVLFMTDGYIGNETEILAAIQDRIKGARLFSFGVGSSVNRYLLDQMAEVGRGAVQYVRPDEDTEEAVNKFYKRISSPCLTDIVIDWNGLKVTDVYPKRIPDLFANQPLIVYGRYEEQGSAIIKVKGKQIIDTGIMELNVALPEEKKENESLASLWTRAKIKELMDKQFRGEIPEIVQEITETALKYRLMSQYTSFVAIEETYVTEGGESKKVQVPVPMPEYVSYEGVFGKKDACVASMAYSAQTVSCNKGSATIRLARECAIVQPFVYDAAKNIEKILPTEEIKPFEITIIDTKAHTRLVLNYKGEIWSAYGTDSAKLVKKISIDETKDLLNKIESLLGKQLATNGPNTIKITLKGKTTEFKFTLKEDPNLAEELRALLQKIYSLV